MSRRDEERKKMSIEERTDRAKVKLQRLQEVLRHFVGGLGIEETAARMSVSRDTVRRYRVFLELDTGKAWRGTGKRTGKHSSAAAMRELAS